MKTSNYTDQKAATIIGLKEGGMPLTRVCCQFGISVPTFYKWRNKYLSKDPHIEKRIHKPDKAEIEELNKKHDAQHCEETRMRVVDEIAREELARSHHNE